MQTHRVPLSAILAIVIASLVTISCSQTPAEVEVEPDKPSDTATVTLESDRTASATVGAAGGVLETTATDGTLYQLTVPPFALPSDVDITMTPVGAVADLPLSGELTAGVQFAPDGLHFALPAIVTVEPSGALPSGVTGFNWAAQGEDFQLEIVSEVDGTLSFEISHFSGYAAGPTVPADIIAWISDNSASATTGRAFVSRALGVAASQGDDATAYPPILRNGTTPG